jgi:ATP-dependent exoDNAse (exonuclease V) beta subunit
MTKTQGFATTDPEAKAVVVELLSSLGGEPFLEERLHRARRLPEPRYAEAQWRDLVALRAILRQSVAELRVVFAERRSVDFVELALAAQQALGRVDEPSELLLALDRRIQHFLIDEFQDTSRIQLKLIELLTAGWQRGDGRSLFLVGDPMQSIYRFRDADMSLFERVIAQGIGDIHCEFLQLEANFRSAPRLVGWVNATFARVFATGDGIDRAQARFHSSHAERVAGRGQDVSVHEIISDDDSEELARVISVLEQERAGSPAQSIAVLVQSRPHLLGLHDRLAARGWPVHALEIDAVTESQCGQDLLGLTRALSHLADRIAWLALLRAPWCGLRWDDLEKLCGDEPQRTVWELMQQDERVARLSVDGRARLTFVRGVLEQTLAAAPVTPFAHGVERCWHSLRGPACASEAERIIAEQFFSRLAELAYEGGGSVEPATLEQAFSRPVASPGPRPEGGIEIMTIHRAKGLVFDTVVVFGLARPPRRDDPRALYWHERAGAHGAELVLAPIQRDDDALGRFLRAHEEAGEDAERARVLYVAVTRARERLHLVYRLPPEQGTPPPRSLLSWLLPAIGDQPRAADPAPPTSVITPVTAVHPRLSRLPDVPEVPAPEARRAEVLDPRPEFEWAGRTAAHVGTIVHAELLAIGERGVEEFTRNEPSRRKYRYARRLALLGVDPSEIDEASIRVEEALRRVLEDARGRWILESHSEARSELRLSVRVGNELRHLQLDRTFVDDTGVRWIVDYKTSGHEGTHLEAFLDSEVARYREQLENYATAMAEIDARPIRVALYFPLLGGFRDWAAAPLKANRTG